MSETKSYHFDERIKIVCQLMVVELASNLRGTMAILVPYAVGKQGTGQVNQPTCELLQAVLRCEVEQGGQLVLEIHWNTNSLALYTQPLGVDHCIKHMMKNVNISGPSIQTLFVMCFTTIVLTLVTSAATEWTMSWSLPLVTSAATG